MIRRVHGLLVLVIGLGMVGASGFVVLGAADRVLDARAALSIGVLWTVVNAIAPAVLLPVEQEIARCVASCRARDEPWAAQVATLGAIAAGLTLGVCVIVLALSSQIAGWLFGDRVVAVVAAVGVTVAFAVQHVSRGVFSGEGRFGRYGVQLLVDGSLRVVLVLVLAITGMASLSSIALVLVLAPMLSVVATVPLRRSAHVGRSALSPDREQLRAVSGLITAQTANSLVVGGGGLAAAVLADGHEVTAAAGLVAVLVFARVPLVAFYSVQPALIPRFATARELGEWAAFARFLTVVQAGVTVLGLVIAGLGLTAGSRAVRVLFGPAVQVSGVVLAAALVGVTGCIVATVATQSLIALRRYRAGAVVWCASLATYVAALLVPVHPLERRVMTAFLLAAGVAAAMGSVWARLVLHRECARRIDGEQHARPPLLNALTYAPAAGRVDR